MIRGSIVALVTPMDPTGAVDDQALARLVEWHIEAGTTAIVAVGTTGESATLDEAEHCAVIARIVELVAGRIPVIGGTGANSTTEAIRLTRCAADAGADAALLVTPYYNKPTQAGLIAHHSAVAAAVAIPQILYNVPGRTACDMRPETVAELARVDNIVGVKEATGDLARVEQMRTLCGADFALYSGDDATGCEFMLRGGDGVISVTANVAPHAMAALCRAALAGEQSVATDLDARLAHLHRHLFAESNPIPVKWALAEMGLMQTGIRLPLTWLAPDCHARVRQALVDAGVL
ncbi:MAG: 4-hydroxy-tetrahydrodipicolinate synthase [Chromatiaceae bacterium]|nr:MAG: 4-hydroxy-tetrahydrodipicolinate synthase [Chromatiaceae bacterium]